MHRPAEGPILVKFGLLFCRVYGGEGGIRTPDSLTTMPDFESGAFNRALPPLRSLVVETRLRQLGRRAAPVRPAARAFSFARYLTKFYARGV